jgi:hypothetical protein
VSVTVVKSIPHYGSWNVGSRVRSRRRGRDTESQGEVENEVEV